MIIKIKNYKLIFLLIPIDVGKKNEFFQHRIDKFYILIVSIRLYMNYFELFSLPKKFKINKKILSHNFYKLQLIYHPDLFIDSSISKQKFFLKKSIEINKGYKTLKNFLSRAQYLLYLNNFNIDDQSVLSNSNQFLLKHFALYEELELIKTKQHNEKEWCLFYSKIERQIKKYKQNIEIELDKENWEHSVNIISELLFFLKIEKNLKKKKLLFYDKIN